MLRKLTGTYSTINKSDAVVIVEGEKEAVEGFVRWCEKGPGLGVKVGTVTVEYGEGQGVFDGFNVD